MGTQRTVPRPLPHHRFRHAIDYLRHWCASALRVQIPAYRSLVRRTRKHFDGIIDAVTWGLSNSRVEGINANTRLLNNRAHGHMTPDALVATTYLTLGGITMPPPTGASEWVHVFDAGVTPLRDDGRMDITAVVERVQQVAAARSAARGASRDELEAAMRTVTEVESWLAGAKAALTSALSTQVSFPEQSIADCTRGSTRDAARERERANTLDAVPSLADALDDGRVTPGHVDEVSRASEALDDEDQRSELRDRLDRGGLLDVAAAATVAEWRRRLALETRRLRTDDGMDRLERQRRATSLRTWTDGDGMWCLSARFDPVTGVSLAAKLETAVNALFAESVPDTCPVDPIDKQRHLAALALARLLDGGVAGGADAAGGRPGRPEYVVVVDASLPDGAGGPTVDWGIPVEIPHRVLVEQMTDDVAIEGIVVCNGVVLHAPGRLDLGRSTRLANRAQRRALRALYATCAIPGCTVRYDRCKLHHVTWWRHGGRTDLDNLLPVCTDHHSKIHDAGWTVTLGPRREFAVRYPDGTIHNTGPPSRRAA